MDQEKKEDVKVGFVLSITLVGTVMLGLFLFAPVGYYLEKWNNVWSDSGDGISISGSWSSEEDGAWERQHLAKNDCEVRASMFYKLPAEAVATYPFSADDYQTYDCYGLKLDQIPTIDNE